MKTYNNQKILKLHVIGIIGLIFLLSFFNCEIPDTDDSIYPLRAATDGVFGESNDCNPVIDNVESRLMALVGPSNYQYKVGNTGDLDGFANHWQGIAMSHMDQAHLYLSRSKQGGHETFNYAHLDGVDDPYYYLEYENGTEPTYYHDLHGSQDHGNHIQAIGQYLLFSHLDLSNSPAHTYLEILDLTTDIVYDQQSVKPSLRSIHLTTTGFSDVDYLGNAGIIKLDSGYFLIVDTVYTKNHTTNALDDFLGFQVYLSDSTSIDSTYSQKWALPLHKIINPVSGLPCFEANNDVRYQGVDIIGQTDGTIFLAATRPEAIDLFEFIATSDDLNDVQVNLVAKIEGFNAVETDAFQFGGSVMVWQYFDNPPDMLVMCIESWDGDNIPLDTHSYFEIWN